MQYCIQIKIKLQLIMLNFFSLNMVDFLRQEAIYQNVHKRKGKGQLRNYFNKILLIIRKTVSIRIWIQNNC